MSSSTKIEWATKTWNPVVGCTHVSAGCDHCYAAREASGRLKHHPLYAGLAEGGRFTGEVRLVPDRLGDPLTWRRHERVFVNSMSDLFHRDVPDDFIIEVFAVMMAAHRHTFQVLTKRPGRMASLLGDTDDFDAAVASLWFNWARKDHPYYDADITPPFPSSNVWLGTSVEDQRWADIRIPQLLRTPAAVRFLSCEPLLGPIDLGCGIGTPKVDWVIVGGESGPRARPMHPQWVRDLRDQCVAAGIPFFFKQWGEWRPASGVEPYPRHDFWDPFPPRVTAMYRVGKKAAGRELDGQTWDNYPVGEAVPA